jgi:exodeoxyribonuclease VII small subunit
MADEDLNQLGYAAAIDEVELILAELERADVDVDHLVERLARAAALIELCRARIDGARADVERLDIPDSTQ